MSDVQHYVWHSRRHENSVVDTLQSLIVAFVLAMTFRGFVTEGFVIPTGSMAPTLLGQHKALRSPQTGWEFPAGIHPRQPDSTVDHAADPMLGPEFPGAGSADRYARTRMGDRILVLKSLYPFVSPSRFDVVVFKNPTNPNGEDGNYIKRLIGLPGESIWLADGDIFAGDAEEPDNLDAYRIQRKPEYVQRAVWQPVHDSDFVPSRPEGLDGFYRGPPWMGAHWKTKAEDWTDPTARDLRTYRCDVADATILEWEDHIRIIDDWAPYNMLVVRPDRRDAFFVNDVRVSAAIVPDVDGLEMAFTLEAMGHQYEFAIAGGQASVRMRSAEYGDEFMDQGWTGADPVAVGAFAAGRPTSVEFWHVDQSMSIFVAGKRVAHFEYDWSPEERLQFATGRGGSVADLASLRPATRPVLRWRFSGSPVSLHSVRVDRDLFYRTDRLTQSAKKNPTSPDPETGRDYDDIVWAGNYAYGTNPDNLALLGPDHFFMAGDNSTASSDSRLWGNPHPLVATQIDPAPFVVNRKLLLGKAWVVYFPAPRSATKNGKPFIPDFGRLRFIR